MDDIFFRQCMDVLDSIYYGIPPDHLRYNLKVSNDSVNELLGFLGEKDLVFEICMGDEVVEYALTDMGLKTIKGYEKVSKLLNEPH